MMILNHDQKIEGPFLIKIIQGFINFWPLLSKLGGIHISIYIYIIYIYRQIDQQLGE